MTWDFGEANVLGPSTGSWPNTVKHIANALEAWGSSIPGARVFMADAATNGVPANVIISTDPPYYNNIGYADLSDFFFVWLRRTLRNIEPGLFRRILTPKSEELVATPYRKHERVAGFAQTTWEEMSPDDRAEAFFLDGMKRALIGFSSACSEAPALVYYAFKQTEAASAGVLSPGWATFLQAVVDAGLSVDGTWPIRSEHSSRSVSQNSNALASSVALVCRRREATATTITRADFLRALRREMPAALAEIRRAGVGPTDIQQAALGPGIGIFTRHARVLNTDGTPMLVKDALKLVNQVREEIASHGEAEYDSETRFALDWFAAKGFENGKSGDAINMTNAVNISLEGMNAAGFFEARGGDARLLKREELEKQRAELVRKKGVAEASLRTVWQACQHFITQLTAEDGGIDAAARLYNELGALAEPAHALARRLYDICEQKQWAAEGRFYNHLHQEWNAIEKRAAALAEAGKGHDLFSR